jgi:glycosyltransferase involved in cell wall biosynthesis
LLQGSALNSGTGMMVTNRLAIVTEQVLYNDGQGRVNLEIAAAALQAGYSLLIVARECHAAIRDTPLCRFSRIGLNWIPTQLVKNAIFAIQSTRRLGKAAPDLDIVHVNGFNTWAHSDVNTVHFVHATWLASPYYPFRRWWRSVYALYQYCYSCLNARLEKMAFARSRQLIAVSRAVQAELCNIGVPDDKIRVIYNGVDTEQFHPGLADRARFGLPPSEFTLLFAGDIRTPRKNLETVLRSLTRAPGVHLAVAGKLDASPYPSLARQLNVDERVHFLGLINDMASLMRSVDALVFPSRYDPLGLVLVEALASGLPVLTARTVGAAEIVGDAGRVLDDPDDYLTLSKWVRDLAEDPGLRRSMGVAGRAIALRYSWPEMAKQYLDVYNGLSTT